MERPFSLLLKNLGLVLVPVLMDLASFILVFFTIGFVGESTFRLTPALTVGVPSVGDILNQKIIYSGLQSVDQSVLLNQTGIILLISLITMVLGAFANAGFIGLLHETAKKNATPSAGSFFRYASRYGLRLLGLNIVISVVAILGIILGLLLFIVGALVFLVIFIILRVKYIYWEFTIVAEDLGILDAFGRSRELYDQRSPELASVLWTIVGANLIFGVVFNLVWHPIFLVLGIFVYGFAATGLQLALMLTMPGQPAEIPPALIEGGI